MGIVLSGRWAIRQRAGSYPLKSVVQACRQAHPDGVARLDGAASDDDTHYARLPDQRAVSALN